MNKKYVAAAILTLLNFACNDPTGDSTASVSTDTTTTPAVAPLAAPVATPAASPKASPSTTPSASPSPKSSPTPSPSPSPSPSPTTTPVQTATYGDYSCSLMSDNSVRCNGQAITGLVRNGSNGYLSVVVGANIGCVFEDSQGTPTACTTYPKSGCNNPPMDADIQCWTVGDPTPVVLNGNAEWGFNSTYSLGPVSMAADAGNLSEVCVTFAVYTKQTSPWQWVQNVTACGSATTAQDTIQ